MAPRPRDLAERPRRRGLGIDDRLNGNTDAMGNALPNGTLKQGLLQHHGEPYPDFASEIASFNRQSLNALYDG